MNHIPIAETKPLAPYFGGKSRMAKEITARIHAIPHQCYAEPFIGMGGVFLRRTHKAPCEVINATLNLNRQLMLLCQRADGVTIIVIPKV